MEDKYYLCVDPQTRRLYRYNIDTHTIKIEQRLEPSVAGKIETELDELETLRGFNNVQWAYNSPQAWAYRRRALAKHLLQQEVLPFPSFSTTKPLSSVIADQTHVQVRVDLSSYINVDQWSEPQSDDDQPLNTDEHFVFSKAKMEATDLICLSYTGSEVIKQFYRKLRRHYQLELRPHSTFHKFCLKVKGRNDYFLQSCPLFDYKEVRGVLRGQEELVLTLTEIPKINDSTFPAFTNYYKPVTELREAVLFWYPPVHLPYQQEACQEKPHLMHPRIQSTRPQQPTHILYKSLLQNASDPVHELSTDDSEWPFQVTLCGLDGVLTLLNQAFSGNATDNGTIHPTYLVLPTEKGNNVGRNASLHTARRNSMPSIRDKSVSKSGRARNTLHTASGSSKTLEDTLGQFKLPVVPYVYAFEFKLMFSNKVLPHCQMFLKYFPFEVNARIHQKVRFPIKVSEVPKEARLGVNIHVQSQQGDSMIMGCTTISVFDEHTRLRTGLHRLNVWPFYRIEERLSCMGEYWGPVEDPFPEDDRNKLHYCQLYLQFDSYVTEEIYYSLKHYGKARTRFSSPYDALAERRSNATEDLQEADASFINTKPTVEEIAELEHLLKIDSLTQLTKSQRRLLFICRDHYKSLPLMLQLFLRSVDWTRPLQVREAHRLLEEWTPLNPEDALALLSSDFSDERVRLHGTRRVALFCEDDLVLYLPQLVQALCFESQHYSPLAELLITKALRNPYVIGHELFWCLRSQLHIKAFCERLGLVLEQFLMLCGRYRKVLLKELFIVNLNHNIGLTVKEVNDKERTQTLRNLLSEQTRQLPDSFTLPIGSGVEARSIALSGCKVMNSKKVPLFISVVPSESTGHNIPVMYKIGDDLQQDCLSLQAIRVMDSIWLEHGLDLKMKTYKVVATGDQAGMIEIVDNAQTTSKIQKGYGGVVGPLRKEPLQHYIKENNPNDLEGAIDNFTRSCAGFCVATYILGIGDRHNDNIMIHKLGHLFHIDFGHFLGNFKKKAGFKRERSKFVFTEEMIYVMGGRESEAFGLFKEYCCEAYNLIRKQGDRIITLFKMMVSAGIPELRSYHNIEYLKDRLAVKLTDMEAKDLFLEEVDIALNDVYRRLDNLIHATIRK